MKLTEKLGLRKKKGSEGDYRPQATFSFEYFVPKTAQGVQNLYDRMNRMFEASLPEFIDITWNAGGGRMSQLSTDLVSTAQSVLGLETCMHLTCTNMPVEQIDAALESAYHSGCENILALRGDPPVNSGGHWQAVDGGFQYAKDLIHYIREKYGDHFAIGVAGYPEAHPELKDSARDLQYLKEKIDAGGDFIVTQMFYDVDNFIDWCGRVRNMGIEVPIIPGIMPITTYAAFLRRAQWGRITIPQHFIDRLDPVKDDDQMVREVGIELMVELCNKILESGFVNHLHIYTMNLEKVPLLLLDRLRLLPSEDEVNERGPTMLPWRKSLNPNRAKEEMRPIFWQRRPYSYVARTSQWAIDEFPNGRFGDSSSPAYGDLDLCGSSLIRQSGKRSLELWSTPNTVNDISHLVISYLKGEINCLPWSDVPIDKEIDRILNHLIVLNERNLITINSQPQINGMKSNDVIHGWGPKDGYVYQKQYLEFLMPKDKLPSLVKELVHNEVLTYYAIDYEGKLYSNHPDGSKANAVTWGIFPGREVVQPTIVEKVSFLAWKEEFYRILEEWKYNFIDNEITSSAEILDYLINNYVLINIVDNDFISPDDHIFDLLIKLTT